MNENDPQNNSGNRLNISPGFGVPSPSSFRISPNTDPVHIEPAADEAISEDVVDVAASAGTIPAPSSEVSSIASPYVTTSVPVRPVGSIEIPRPSTSERQPWDPDSMLIPQTPVAYQQVAPAPAPQPAPLLVQEAPPAAIVAPPVADGKSTAGALVLLPGEDLIMQLGALYLTNRRAILYAPTILRAAFLRDVDAIGTLTERSSGWIFFLALLMLAFAAGGTYIMILGSQINFLGLNSSSLPLLVIPLAILGLILLVTYFFWVKRSLFLSVGGRPLIVVSISAWNQRKLESVDGFVNAFSQAKDVIDAEQRHG